MIISFILVTWMCASGVILWGEIRCRSLLGVKGLSVQTWRSLLWTSEEEKHFIPCSPGAVFLFTYILLEVSYLITKNKHGSFKQTHSNTPAVEGPKRLFQFLPRELSPLQQLHSLHLYGKGYICQIKLIFLFSCKRFLYKHNRFITARTRFPWA